MHFDLLSFLLGCGVAGVVIYLWAFIGVIREKLPEDAFENKHNRSGR